MSMLEDHEMQPGDSPDLAGGSEQTSEQGNGGRWTRSVGRVFLWSVAIVIAFVLWAALSPDSLGAIMTSAMNSVSSGIGWIYLVVPFAAIVMLVWFASSRFGRIRLGSEES